MQFRPFVDAIQKLQLKLLLKQTTSYLHTGIKLHRIHIYNVSCQKNTQNTQFTPDIRMAKMQCLFPSKF